MLFRGFYKYILTAEYQTNDYVEFGDNSYRVLANTLAGETPITTPAKFQILGIAFASTNHGKTVYVDSVYGNDATGAREDENLPFLTPAAAITASLSGDMIYVRAGTYAINVPLTLKAGVNIYNDTNVFYDGTGNPAGTIFRDNGVTYVGSIVGHARFISSTNVLLSVTNATSKVIFEMDGVNANSSITLASNRGCSILNRQASGIIPSVGITYTLSGTAQNHKIDTGSLDSITMAGSTSMYLDLKFITMNSITFRGLHMSFWGNLVSQLTTMNSAYGSVHIAEIETLTNSSTGIIDVVGLIDDGTSSSGTLHLSGLTFLTSTSGGIIFSYSDFTCACTNTTVYSYGALGAGSSFAGGILRSFGTTLGITLSASVNAILMGKTTGAITTSGDVTLETRQNITNAAGTALTIGAGTGASVFNIYSDIVGTTSGVTISTGGNAGTFKQMVGIIRGNRAILTAGTGTITNLHLRGRLETITAANSAVLLTGAAPITCILAGEIVAGTTATECITTTNPFSARIYPGAVTNVALPAGITPLVTGMVVDVLVI